LTTAHRTTRHFLPELLRSPSLPIILIISALAIGLAALVPLVGSSFATTTSGNVDRLEQERFDWQARVQERELEVAASAGLNRVEEIARKDLGMVEPQETHYVTVPLPAPEPRRLPARYLPQSPEETGSEPALWERVVDWVLP
jgi:cell division protein FtsL